MKKSTGKTMFGLIFIFALLIITSASCASAGGQVKSADSQVNSADDQVDSAASIDTSRYLEPVCKKAACDSDIVYREIKGPQGEIVELLLDVYQPRGDKTVNRPALVILHAGGFIMGTKDAGLEPVLARDLAKLGYVTVPINYRLSENPITDWEGTLANATEDAAAAVDWLVENSEKYGVDKNNIAILGYSAGGFLSTHLVYNDKQNISWNKKSIVCVLSLSGGYLSGLGAPDKNDPPCLCIHGTKDVTVSPSQSENLVQVLKNSGVKAELYSVEGADHDLYKYYDEVLGKIKDYLYKAMIKQT